MSVSQLRIDQVEAALIALLSSGVPVEYGAQVDVESLGDKDFDDDGRLALQPPALRVRFAGAQYDNLRDNQRLSYQAKLSYEILCFESSLRSRADERNQTLALVAAVLDQMAGARLTLADTSVTMPIGLRGVALVETDQGPVDQLFSVLLDVEGIAQFNGVNA